MYSAVFIFSGRLNHFLRRDQKDQAIQIEFQGRQSVKHLAESLGVPHPEIGQVRVNGQEGSLDAITMDGDEVSLHPVQDGCPIEPRFLLDSHLGRLASYLRILGFDCLYQNHIDDEDIVESIREDERILLTRDRRLLMRKVVRYGYCLRSLEPRVQLTEVVNRFDLRDRISPFQRCPRCNHPLDSTSKEAVFHRLEPLTKLYFDEFHICPACSQIYWKGSHFERLQVFIEQLINPRNLD